MPDDARSIWAKQVVFEIGSVGADYDKIRATNFGRPQDFFVHASHSHNVSDRAIGIRT